MIEGEWENVRKWRSRDSKLISPFHNFTEQFLPGPVADPHTGGDPVLSQILLQKLRKGTNEQ